MINFEKLWNDFVSDLPTDVAVIAENYTMDAFDKEQWDGEKWTKRKDGDSSRALLVGHFGSANLKKNIRFEVENDTVVIQTDTEYAQIHNEGGTIEQTPTPKQRRFFWAMFRQTKETHWKAMALAKKLKIEMPKRQFIGESQELNEQIEAHILNSFEKHFDEYL